MSLFLGFLHRHTAQKSLLARAVGSFVLNIAEANGRWHNGEKRNLFWVARGSTFECAALMQILMRRSKVSADEYDELFKPFDDIAKMLSGLIRSVESLSQKP